MAGICGEIKEKSGKGIEMSGKTRIKIIVDLLMTLALLFLMPYGMVGEAAHEWIGTGMFVLFVLHHILNRGWTAHFLKGRYTIQRLVQTVLVLLVLSSFLGSMLSGILLSRHVFAFLDIRGGISFARNLHMVSAYWGFVWMSLHLGIHWNMVIRMAGKRFQKPSYVRKWTARAAALLIVGYGIYAFIKREIGSYMFLKTHFVFFDYQEPLLFFMLDYIAVMGMFVFIGYYGCGRLKKMRETEKKE